MTSELIIQGVLADGSAVLCRSHLEPEIDQSTRVIVVGDSPALVDSLVRCLWQQVGARTPTTCVQVAGAGSVTECRANQSHVAHVVVVVVNRPASVHLRQVVSSLAALPGARIVGVHQGSSTDLPPGVARLQAIAAPTNPCAAVEDVLQVVGLGPDDRRAFISYAHADAGLALSLTSELQQYGFRVFIDHHGIRPSHDWRATLRDAIVDTGLVIAIESPHAATSRWMRWELAFARARGCAVAAIAQPGAAPVSGPVPRFVLGAMPDAADFAVQQHRIQVTAMRNRDLAGIEMELLAAGCQPVIQGRYIETARAVALIDPRPAAARQFRLVKERLTHAGGTRKAAVISPRPVLASNRLDQQFLTRTGVEHHPTGSRRATRGLM